MTNEDLALAEVGRAGQRDALKTLAWGLLWTAGAVWFVLNGLGSPVDDYRLMVHARTASGEIVDTWQEVEASDSGADSWFSGIAYRFRLPDGRLVEGGSRGTGPLAADLVNLKDPVPVEVEYHPDDPSLNRLKGDGSQSLGEWLRRFGLQGLLLTLFGAPGIALLRDGIRGLHKQKKANG